MKDNYDYCVVGTGIAGGTIIKYLVEKKYNVIVVEAGGNRHKSYDYINVGREFGLRSTISIQRGGTSNLWHGVLSMLDEIDFVKRNWINGSGWPIKYNELMPYYKDVAKLFGIEDFEYFFLNKLNTELKKDLKSINFSRDVLENKMFQQPLNILNFKSLISNLEKKYSNLKILSNSKACEFVIDKNKVKFLKAGTKRGFINIKAETFILASGALESPKILLNSNFKNKNIGKYLMDHPMGNLCQIKFKNPVKGQIYSAKKYKSKIAIKAGLTFLKKIQEDYNLPNHCFYFRPSFSEGIDNKSERVKLSLLAFKDGKVKLKDILFLFMNLNIVLQIIVYKLSYNTTYKYADLFFVSEQTPYEKSCVKLSENEIDEYGYKKALVNWVVSKFDEDSVEKCYEILKEKALSKNDYEFSHSFENINWRKNYTSAAHHVGTCRVGNSSDDGVVDRNLKVFGSDNLFICDGSIFRTAGNVNNGFTIAAFAKRLVDYLINKNE